VHSQANVLAEHPRDTCSDGKTPQPIIAIRKYGSAGGEVVYIAFNETWRLRRRYGELYYRQFWSQLINRLGLSHALGAQKRFVIRTDRQNYRSEDRVTLTVEAYDEEFEPLIVDKLPEGQLTAEMIVPDKEGQPGNLREIALSPLRDGIYEARIPVFDAGEYQIRIKDPVAERFAEVRFAVTGLSAERRSATRNVSLQQQLATATGGKAYDLESVESLVDELNLVSQPETRTRVKPLWSTPLWFGVVVLLMLGEWFSRKMMNLT